ncbi:50S ribosomal protein L32 [Vaginisenegalia massiliensis]|uniref:50S ribosomal protein L32 n=1 Tax=Vaginisenegalia massiliensis TaxID=2058294 RepID=UPI000F52EC38|nr:50S ribosomal protein L32 [Vaginisenegalia massiliensis]
MAVPKRRTSKAKKNARRTHKKLKTPNISIDALTGAYHRSHYISTDGTYKGRQVLEKE